VPAAALAIGTGHAAWWLVPLGLASLSIAAIAWNELANKGKTVRELLRAAPALFVYYHARLAGYLVRRAGLAFGVRPPARIDRDELAASFPRPRGAA
jgi:hypothetical protein